MYIERMRRRVAAATVTVMTGARLREARETIGLTQREMQVRTGISQSAQSRFERGVASSIDLDALDRLVAEMGGRLHVTLEFRFLASRARQRDSLHARCVGFVARRLQRAGYSVATEVEIEGRFGLGFIDILAFDPFTGSLLVIEVKTELDDVGQIQRTLGWYAAQAGGAARARGWRARSLRAALFVVATEAADRQLVANRELVDVAFPIRAERIASWIEKPRSAPWAAGYAVAMIDPHARGRAWLRKSRLDGRRRRNPYLDYADAVRRLEGSDGRQPRSRVTRASR